MSLITTLTRDYLTRSFKPFIFTDDYDSVLDYENLQNLGLYVHIPFCKSICSFCPYCKELYTPEKCNAYIDYLIKEIHMVAGRAGQGADTAQKGEGARKEVTSLYFGGGTPALAHERLSEIIDAVNEHFIVTEGIGVELHPDNVTPEILASLKKAGVTKISIGIQSFQEKYQSVLGRKAVDAVSLKEVLAKVHFETVSFDFIFALPGQTYDELKSDIDMAFECGANHIAVYPFIDFSFA
ncbi:MAG: radical SAM protein, partial [Spirochaetaceae bacterium]|nr:radical SAM protein [Spirochaetaceae bacterium]